MARVERNYTTLLSALLLGVLGFDAYGQTTLPTIVVTAPRLGGGTIDCIGMLCGGAVLQVQLATQGMYAEISVEDVPVDKAKFCPRLKAKRPANCSYNSPPSTPQFDPNWQPNGCGNGSIASGIVNALIGMGYPWTGGTGLDNPAAGVNFSSACNAHDLCYGMVVESRSVCDSRFSTNLNVACATSSNSACGVIATGYASAVINFGAESYNGGIADNVCAAWVSDMRNNGCSP